MSNPIQQPKAAMKNKTEKDWEATLTTLRQQKAWEEMWRLVTKVPVRWSVRLLVQLKEVGWRPKESGAEQEEFTKLTRLAQECSKKERLFLGSLMQRQITLEGHGDHITSLAISPDGRLLVSGSGGRHDDPIRVWSLPDGELLHTLEGQRGSVTALAFVSGNRLLASGGNLSRLWFWDLAEGRCLHSLKIHKGVISGLVISPCGNFMITADLDGMIYLSDRTEIRTLAKNSSEVWCLAISPNGKLLASGHSNNTIRLWSLPDGTLLSTLKGHTQPVWALTISSDSRILASGGDDDTVRLWSLPEGAELDSLVIPLSSRDSLFSSSFYSSNSLAMSSDKQIIAGSMRWHDRDIGQWWHLPDNIALPRLKDCSGPLIFSPDSQTLIIGGGDSCSGNLQIWDLRLANINLLSAEQTHFQDLTLIQEALQQKDILETEKAWLKFLFALITRYFAMQKILLLQAEHLENTETQEMFYRLCIEYESSLAREFACSQASAPNHPQRRALFYVLTGQWERYDQWDVDHRFLTTAYEHAQTNVQKDVMTQIRRSGRLDLAQIIAARRLCSDRSGRMTEEEWSTLLALLTDNRSWSEMWRLLQDAPAVWSAQILLRFQEAGWMPEHKTEQSIFLQLIELAEAYHPENASTLVEESFCYATVAGHTDSISCLMMSSDGELLASGSDDDTVRLWRVSDGVSLHSMKGTVYSLQFSPDKQVLTGHFYPIVPFKPLHKEPPGNIEIWRGDKPWNEIVRRWHPANGKALPTLTLRLERSYPEAVAAHSAISPDGQILAEGYFQDRIVQVWDVSNRTILHIVEGLSGGIVNIAFNANGHILAIIEENSIIRLWRISDKTLLRTLDGSAYEDPVLKASFSPDESILIGSGRTGTVYVWRISDGSLLHTLETKDVYGGCSLISALCLDEQMFVSLGYDVKNSSTKVYIWNLSEGTTPQELKGCTEKVSSIAMSPNGLILATGGEDGSIQLWKLWRIHLQRLLFQRTNVEDLKLIQNILQQKNLTDVERRWLEFLLALTRWQKRFDVDLGEAPKGIPGGEFDVEIGA